MLIVRIILLLCVFSLSRGADKNLTMHFILHSHDDAGWVHTFDEYYTDKVSIILDNVIGELILDSDKIFHWSEISYLQRWWQDQTRTTQDMVKSLVSEDRFVFVNSGWVMHDEATTNYKEMISNMKLGLEFVHENFGVKPSIGWQIDPFGASASMVSILHKLGYKKLVHNRVVNEIKTQMSTSDGFSFNWQGHQVDPNERNSKIFTTFMQYHYNLPDIRMIDEKFLDIDMVAYAPKLYNLSVQPVIDSINA
jgi:hypothetical protein